MSQSSELDDKELVAEEYVTKRAISPEVEAILYKPIQVLDKGFIRVIDYMGNDSAIVQAARVSYGVGTKKGNSDRSLINYLMRNEHTSPFEMCEIKLHVKLPIFVARQWIRHRTANVNEYSARYSIMKNEFYFPRLEDVCGQSTSNKQARGEQVDQGYAEKVLDIIKQDSLRAYDHYQLMLNSDELGNTVDHSRAPIAREIARITLPLNTYTEFYWKIDLHNLLRFLRLRMSSHAQLEIRKYADVIADIVRQWTPFVYEAFERHMLNSQKLSSECFAILKELVNGGNPKFEDYTVGTSEWNELMTKLGQSERLV